MGILSCPSHKITIDVKGKLFCPNKHFSIQSRIKIRSRIWLKEMYAVWNYLKKWWKMRDEILNSQTCIVNLVGENNPTIIELVWLWIRPGNSQV